MRFTRYHGLMAGTATALALSSGCALGPAFRRPTLAIPASYDTQAASDALSADLGWWEIINDDPVLKALVQEGLATNQDLRIAVSRMEEARALAGINRLGPDLDLSGSAQRQRAIVAGMGPLPVPGNNFSANLSASWELDIWGRIRRSQEGARAQYLASDQGQRAVRLSLIGDLVGGYYGLQALDLQLATARRTLESRKHSLALLQNRLDGGVGDRLETSQATAAMAQTQATVPQLEEAVHRQENQLNLLLGRMPGSIQRGRPLDATPPKGIAPGLPAQLLERRPDVRQSEELLRAANAEVGVATAEMLPRLSLTGALGLQSLELADLGKSGQRTWSVGGGLLAPVFHGGALRRQRQAAQQRWEQAKASYEKTVLAALGDTSNALVAVAKSKEIVQAQQAALVSLREAERIAQLRFDGGVSPYLEVLDAQRELFNVELALASSLCDQQRSVIRLYLALGGGWNRPAPTNSPAPVKP